MLSPCSPSQELRLDIEDVKSMARSQTQILLAEIERLKAGHS